LPSLIDGGDEHVGKQIVDALKVAVGLRPEIRLRALSTEPGALETE
jgi:hypothetical protein